MRSMIRCTCFKFSLSCSISTTFVKESGFFYPNISGFILNRSRHQSCRCVHISPIGKILSLHCVQLSAMSILSAKTPISSGWQRFACHRSSFNLSALTGIAALLVSAEKAAVMHLLHLPLPHSSRFPIAGPMPTRQSAGLVPNSSAIARGWFLRNLCTVPFQLSCAAPIA